MAGVHGCMYNSFVRCTIAFVKELILTGLITEDIIFQSIYIIPKIYKWWNGRCLFNVVCTGGLCVLGKRQRVGGGGGQVYIQGCVYNSFCKNLY